MKHKMETRLKRAVKHNGSVLKICKDGEWITNGNWGISRNLLIEQGLPLDGHENDAAFYKGLGIDFVCSNPDISRVIPDGVLKDVTVTEYRQLPEKHNNKKGVNEYSIVSGSGVLTLVNVVYLQLLVAGQIAGIDLQCKDAKSLLVNRERTFLVMPVRVPDEMAVELESFAFNAREDKPTAKAKGAA